MRTLRINLFWGALKFQIATSALALPKAVVADKPAYAKLYKDDPKMMELLRNQEGKASCTTSA